MLEISWSELLILAVVTLLFVGPKELPVFLRTIGRYAGMLRRQANEFKGHFDSAMREAEMAQLKDEMAKMQASVNAEVMGIDKTIKETGALVQPGLSQSPPSFSAAAQAAVFPQSAGGIASAAVETANTAPALPPSAPMGQVYVKPQPEPEPVSQVQPAALTAETAEAAPAPAEPEPPRPQVVKSES